MTMNDTAIERHRFYYESMIKRFKMDYSFTSELNNVVYNDSDVKTHTSWI